MERNPALQAAADAATDPRAPAAGMDRFAGALRELGSSRTIDETLQLAVELAVELVAGIDLADVMFVGPEGVTTPVTTDAVATQLDRAQADAGDGPCLTTLADEERVVSHDLASDDRWPAFAAAAVDLGVRSVAAYRLFAQRESGQIQLGALNLYGRDPDLGDDALEVGEVFAAHCSAVLDACINAEGLATALRSRDAIGQAKGILMERHGVSADEAYDMLRDASSHRNVKLREVAGEVAETGELRRG